MTLVGGLVLRTASTFVETTYWVEHTEEVIVALDDLRIVLVDAEAARRAYSLTGDESLLEPYATARERTGERQAAIRRLVSDNPAQVERVDALGPLVDQRLKYLDEAVTHRRERGFDLEWEASAVAARRSAPVRAAIEAMIAEERRLLAERQSAVRASFDTMRGVLIGGTCVSAALVLLAFSMLRAESDRRRRSEQALRVSEESLSATLHSIGEGVVATDPSGRVVLMNPMAERLTGWSVAEVRGKPSGEVLRLVDERTRDAVESPLEQALEQQASAAFSGPTLLVARDGVERSVADSATPIRDARGELTGAVMVFRDISAERAAELQRQKDEAALRVARDAAEAATRELEAFSYSVAHDLRTPLRSIDGFSQALLEDYNDVVDEDGKDFLRRVRAAAQRMGQLIDDLLGLSRVSRSELHRDDVDLTALAREIGGKLDQAYPDRVVDFVVAEGLRANADGRLLRIVLENLLGNAWKFTSKQANARVEVGVAEDGGGPAYFVRDNGAGFDMAFASKLFGAFQRMHKSTDFEGTGIGLATVQRIIHRHGGRLWANAAPNQGATFHFTL